MPRIVNSVATILLGTLLIIVGCSRSGSMDAQKIAAYRTEFTLVEEPEDIQTVADVRVSLVGEETVPHDHDGDGKPDHAPEDHDAHDEDGGEHDEDSIEHEEEGEGHDEDKEDHNGHDEGEAEHADEDHDHDGDGKPDHSPDEHGHAHDSEPQEVVMLGSIGGLANPWAETNPEYPFSRREAVMFLADPQAVIENEEAGHKHAPGEECAFCAAHAADKADLIAIVRFVDEKGRVLQTDARKLFDVKEQDTVVVSGRARVTAGGILVVDARGLYVRK